MKGRDDGRGEPSAARIEQARRTLAGLARHTPVIPIADGSFRATPLHGAPVWLKAENLQLTGSFKIRGACNRLAGLDAGKGAKGVVAASAGNHAQGVALAATRLGMSSTIVMPVETPLIKVDRTKSFGAEVILHGDTFEDAYQEACRVGEERGLTFVHAYEDREVIAGQGTIGLEILESLPEIGAVVVPVGGGGLISGIALAIKSRAPKVKVIGVQAKGAAPAVRSFESGGAPVHLDRAETIADAIRFKNSSEVTMPIIRRHVDGMVEVTEEEIAGAVVALMEETKLVSEGAGAVGVAALMSGRLPVEKGGACVVISGGNIDLNMTARVIEQGLSRSGRYLVLRTSIPDRPGRLFPLLSHLADRRINVMDVRHNRAGWRIPLGQVEVELLLETRNADHASEIIEGLRVAGYAVERRSADAG